MQEIQILKNVTDATRIKCTSHGEGQPVVVRFAIGETFGVRCRPCQKLLQQEAKNGKLKRHNVDRYTRSDDR